MVETPPFVTIDGTQSELFAMRGIALELYTCTRCGLAQLSVREPAKLVQHSGARARRVRAEPPPGTFELQIAQAVPSEGAVRVGMESRLAFLLGIDGRRVATMLDGKLPIVLVTNLDWNAAEHARALLARSDISAEIAPSAPAGYR